MFRQRLATHLVLILFLVTASGCSLLNGDAGQPAETPTAPVAPTATTAPEPTPEPSPTPEPTAIPARVEVSEQSLDESGSLVVDRVSLPEDGWLVIQSALDGRPDEVIGRKLLEAGVHEDVAVTVNAELATDPLFATVHEDLGTRGLFEFPGADEPFSERARSEFAVDILLPEPSIEVMDQTVGEDGVVVIAAAEIVEPSWLLIHADAAGEIGPVIGQVYLEPGVYENLPVGIDWRRGTPQLYVVLHEDTGEPGELDYPAEDLPVLVTGQPVVAGFQAAFPPDILVYDQPVIDGQIVVERVISDGPGWLAVYFDQEGQPGLIIGHAPVEDGLNEQIVIELLESAVTPQLYVRLHTDAEPGDAFTPGIDVAVLYNNRLPPAATLRTDTGAHIIAYDQPLGEDDTVTAAVVVAPVDAWLVARADEDGQPGTILGQTWVPAGISRGVAVEVSPRPEDRVFLTVFYDRGETETFEPDTTDTVLANPDRTTVVLPLTLLEPLASP